MGVGNLRWPRWCGVGAVCAWSIFAVAATAQAAITTTTFRTPGAYEFLVPAGVDRVTVVAIGGAGGDCGGLGRGRGGRGAAVTAEVPVVPGARLTVGVAGRGGGCDGSGAGGVGGGGSGGAAGFFSSGGGGASTVAAGSGGRDPLVVAGGGGGAGGLDSEPGKNGFGADAGEGAASGLDGGAGTATAGGRGGSGGNPYGDGRPGAQGQGGGGGDASTLQCAAGAGGGGGGGGLYGGGGGGACRYSNQRVFPSSDSGAGGGGSSFVVAAGTRLLGPLPTTSAPGVSLTYRAAAVRQSARALRLGGPEADGSPSASQTLTVRNVGTAPLVVGGVLLSGADPDAFRVDGGCARPVAPRSSCEVEVGLAGRQRGRRSARLTLLTNAAVAPGPVTLSGGTGPRRGRGKRATRSALLTCPARIAGDPRYRAGLPVCRGRRIAGEVALTGTRSAVRATLSRGAVTYATGRSAKHADGTAFLALEERRPLRSGTYTLVLRGATTRRERVVVRPNATSAPLGGNAF